MTLDFSLIAAEILAETLPFECSKCGLDYEKSMTEISRTLGMFAPVLCPSCGEIQLFDESDLMEALEILVAIHALKQQAGDDAN